MLLDSQGHGARNPGHSDQLLDAGHTDRVERAKSLEKRFAPRWPHAGDTVQLRCDPRPAAPCAVVCDGKAMRLVPHALHEKEALRATGKQNGFGPSWQKDLLPLLGQARHRHLGKQIKLFYLPFNPLKNT